MRLRNVPPDSSRAVTAPSHDAGEPIRMAVAMVSGFLTGAPSTSGAAPAACTPIIRGRDEMIPSAWYSV